MHIINRLDSVSATMITSKNIVWFTSNLVLTHFKDIQHICMQGLYICVYECYKHIIKVLNCVFDAIVGVSSTPVQSHCITNKRYTTNMYARIVYLCVCMFYTLDSNIRQCLRCNDDTQKHCLGHELSWWLIAWRNSQIPRTCLASRSWCTRTRWSRTPRQPRGE